MSATPRMPSIASANDGCPCLCGGRRARATDVNPATYSPARPDRRAGFLLSNNQMLGPFVKSPSWPHLRGCAVTPSVSEMPIPRLTDEESKAVIAALKKLIVDDNSKSPLLDPV